VVDLALVESQLLTLKDVAIGAAGLAGPAGNDSIETTGLELLLDRALDLASGGKASSLLLLDRLALLDLLNGLALLHLATTAERLAVVRLIPLTEGRGIDLDNGRLGEGVGADKLVVGRVVYPAMSAKTQTPRFVQLTGDDNDTGLAGDALGGPRKVAGVETQSAVLVVTAAGADGVDALGTDTGVRGLAARLEGSLLPCHAVRKIKDLPKRDTGSEREGSVPAAVPPERNVGRHLPSGPSSIVLFRGGGHTVVTADTPKLANERDEVKECQAAREGRTCARLAPVWERLCRESLEIPILSESEAQS